MFIAEYLELDTFHGMYSWRRLILIISPASDCLLVYMGTKPREISPSATSDFFLHVLARQPVCWDSMCSYSVIHTTSISQEISWSFNFSSLSIPSSTIFSQYRLFYMYSNWLELGTTQSFWSIVDFSSLFST